MCNRQVPSSVVSVGIVVRLRLLSELKFFLSLLPAVFDLLDLLLEVFLLRIFEAERIESSLAKSGHRGSYRRE